MKENKYEKKHLPKEWITFCMNILQMPGVLHMKLNDLEIIAIIFPGFLREYRNVYILAVGLFTSLNSGDKIPKGLEKMLWE